MPRPRFSFLATAMCVATELAYAQDAAAPTPRPVDPDQRSLSADLRDANGARERSAVLEQVPENPRFPISRYAVEGETRVDADAVQEALRPFTGPDQDFSAIQGAVAALERLHSEAGFGATRIVIPEQDIDDGVVRLKLVQGKIDKVEVIGNKHYSEANIRRSLPGLTEGATPDVKLVGRSLRLANESSSKYAQITFRQTASPAAVDAVVRVADTDPQRFALTYDNTGSTQTGRWRLGLAYQNNKLWDRDHALGLQAVTSPANPGDVAVFVGTYRIPLYAYGSAIDVVAGHSSVNSGIVSTPAAAFGIRGAGDFAGLRYTYLLPKIGAWDQRISAGLDFRYFKNNVLLVGSDESLVPNLQTMPVSVTYSGFVRNAPVEWNATIGISRNIPVGHNGTTEAFQRPGGRAFAEAEYVIVRYSAEVMKTLPRDWRARAFITGQRTRDALIPGEQFSLGGMEYVRGFAERAITNDYGDRGSVELYTPALHGPLNGQVRFVAFADGGVVHRNHALPGETTRTSIASAGLGIRLSIANSVQIRIDSAVVLSGDPQDPRGSTRTHARLMYLF